MHEKNQTNQPDIDHWWGISTIAKYLDMEKRQVRDRISKSPGFPKPSRLKLAGTTSRPRWKSSEIIEWANTAFQLEKDVGGRPRKSQ